MPRTRQTTRPPLQLAYQSAERLLQAIRHLPWPMLLDSGFPSAQAGRFSIACAAPDRQLTIRHPGEASQLEQLRQPPAAPSSHLPFTGGWMGYWSYDAGRLFEALPATTADDLALPLIRMGHYPWALVTDHQLQETWLAGDFDEALADNLQARLQAATAQPDESFQLTGPFVSNLSRTAYLQAFEQVQQWLRSGDAYQVNLTRRFSAGYRGSLYQAWAQLRQAVAAPFAAFMDFGDTSILSLSPERFLLVEADGQVETKPIKGTRPRGENEAEDVLYQQALLNSSKDRAENLMIVDLLRNDLGRVCEPGSISVPDLFTLESFTNVHHLVSRITGQLAADKQPLDLLKACFPGGSITGAPKLRAMAIIEALEPCRRSIYCGAMGYIDRSGRMDFNIAIRTFIATQNRLHIWGGGGLVADSVGPEEYAESHYKVARLIRCLQPDFPPTAD